MRRIALTAIGLLALTPAVASAESGTIARGWPVKAPAGEMAIGPWGGPVVFHRWTDGSDPENIAAFNRDATIRFKDGLILGGGISVIESEPSGRFGVHGGLFGPTRSGYYDAAGGVHKFGQRVPLDGGVFAEATNSIDGFDVRLTHADGSQIWAYHNAQRTDPDLSAPLIDGGPNLIFTAHEVALPGTLLALDKATGALMWSVPNARPVVRYGAGGVIAIIPGRGFVAFDATGAEVVPQRPQDYGRSFTRDGFRLEPATNNGRYSLQAIRPNGTVAWQYSTTTPVGSAIGLPDGTVVFSTDSAQLDWPVGAESLLTRINPVGSRPRPSQLSIGLSRTTFRTSCAHQTTVNNVGSPTCRYNQSRGGLLRIGSPRYTTMFVRFTHGTSASTWTRLSIPAGNSVTRVDHWPGTYRLQVRLGTTGPIIRSIPVTITK